MIRCEFRPIEFWPGDLLPPAKRKQSPFKGTYSDTLELLGRELDHLHAKGIVVELAIDASQIRADGWPRATAKPDHPGVIVSFDSTHGPLRYFTDRFDNLYQRSYVDGWQANLRAIALGLEALRKVERYGITKRGEQYTGWSALPPGAVAAPAVMTLDDAIRFLHDHAPGVEWDYDQPDQVNAAYRVAAKRLHPDAGGDPALFRRLDEARRLILGAS